MDKILEYLSAHPAILTAIIVFVVIVILYFIFKQFVKLALVLLLIAIAAGGYYYFQDPNKMKGKIDKIKSGTETVVKKSKAFYKDSKELISKAKEVPGDVNKLLKGEEEVKK